MKKKRFLTVLGSSLLGCSPEYEPVSVQDTGVLSEDSIDEDFPLGRSPIRTENFSACVSDISHPTARFFDTGSPCIDGMVALIHGRGCEELVYLTDEAGVHRLWCETEDTCDLVHRDEYIAVPNDMDWTEYGTHSNLVCQDRNVSLLYQVRAQTIPVLLGVDESVDSSSSDTGF